MYGYGRMGRGPRKRASIMGRGMEMDYKSNKATNRDKRLEWLKIALVAALTVACIILTVWFHFARDTGYIFPHLYYVPIILACLWWDRKGIALAVFLSVLLLVSSFTGLGSEQIWDDVIRVAVFLTVSVVIAELCARRKNLINTLEERVEGRTAELQARNEELDAFSRTVSHDLIGSLSTLHGYAEVARDAALNEENALEMESIEAIETISMRISHNIEELLDYTRAGKQLDAGHAVRPSSVAAEVAENLAGLMSGMNVEVSIEESMPDILVEEIKLKQVFHNLVANSVKHAAGNGQLHIEIGGKAEEDRATIFVRDDGVGIEKDVQEEIFREFVRMSDGGGKPGLGLGLSIVKRAVEGWGGRVWLESAPGKGSTFFFTAPLAGEAQRVEPQPRSAE